MGFLSRFFCKHKWLVVRCGTYSYHGSMRGTWYDCRCEHCGTFKRFEF